MSKPRDERHKDLFRPSLDEIIDLNHPLAGQTVRYSVKIVAVDNGADQQTLH